MTAETSDKLIQPNAQNHYEVTRDDLPLSCPMPGMQLWNSHPRVFLAIDPRVFLAIEKTGWAMCPYCSAEFTLKK
ncbi:MAG: zinc-finger domain-containing protein [Steroidobacteraceae bacterium]|nr:zinc-finger domain-containing protein [Steroidobacteraceae bacterium]